MTAQISSSVAVLGVGRNIELKARERSREESLHACESLGAEDRGLLDQRDTYFEVPTGRLKLREQRGEGAQLISYQRPDAVQERRSEYRLVDVSQPQALLAALSDALGVRVVVSKQRHLYLWRGARIHLDEVVGLGRFPEFEAVAAANSDLSREERQVATLREAFKIDDGDLIAVSYSDLIIAKTAVSPRDPRS